MSESSMNLNSEINNFSKNKNNKKNEENKDELRNSVYNADFYKNVEEIQFSAFKELDPSQDKIVLKVKDHIPLDRSLEYMSNKTYFNALKRKAIDINYGKAKKSHAERLVEEKEIENNKKIRKLENLVEILISQNPNIDPEILKKFKEE
ncbi:29673_t:CDS:2 [Gigaspora margarita]|uniref:29673_t:CDS:1 n=1 Tax=Gigaspora margarita TaxID=4874 RepID=A0ABN7WX45_GIGMA|nr:29673_t:CDS:2 [Gigaspora margarita]